MSQEKRGKRIIYLYFSGKINAASTQAFLQVITEKLPKDSEVLHIFFNTSGGSVAEGFAFYNILRGLPYEIVMHNVGSVDSIGIVVFLAADTRYSASNATFLIHPVKSAVEEGDVEESFMSEKLSCIQQERKRIMDVIAQRTKIPENDLMRFMHAGELKEAGYALQINLISEIKEIEIPKDAFLIVSTSEDKNNNKTQADKP